MSRVSQHIHSWAVGVREVLLVLCSWLEILDVFLNGFFIAAFDGS